ncbi:Saccharopine dehydrogenase [Balamuthia mandrillaris]
MATNAAAKFDLIVWGATGFTGTLVAEYLAEHAPADLRWALGGRNEDKLKEVKRRAVALNQNLEKTLGIVQGDATDQASMDRVVQQTKVILTTAGPFGRFGTTLVDACVRHGVHYCDITGESPWMRTTIDEYHSQARQKGVHIVHTCGFDSIPSDLGTFFLVEQMRKKYRKECSNVTSYVRLKGGFSGGTAASLITIIEEGKSMRKKIKSKDHTNMRDPFFLNPSGEGKVATSVDKDQALPAYSKDIGRWTIPFVMAAVNTRVVRRSNALMNDAYGHNFHYRETAVSNSFLAAIFTWCIMVLGLIALHVSFTRGLLKKFVLPAPGTGPSREQMRKSFFHFTLVGRTTDGEKLVAVVKGGDPGYLETAKMLSEAALCLVYQQDSLPSKGGVLTPATSMGSLLVERLQQAGITFEIVADANDASSSQKNKKNA